MHSTTAKTRSPRSPTSPGSGPAGSPPRHDRRPGARLRVLAAVAGAGCAHRGRRHRRGAVHDARRPGLPLPGVLHWLRSNLPRPVPGTALPRAPGRRFSCRGHSRRPTPERRRPVTRPGLSLLTPVAVPLWAEGRPAAMPASSESGTTPAAATTQHSKHPQQPQITHPAPPCRSPPRP